MHREHSSAGNKAVFKWLMIGLLVAAGGLFLADHWVHVPQFLPYALLALCPLMHLFGHGGHGAHKHDKADTNPGR